MIDAVTSRTARKVMAVKTYGREVKKAEGGSRRAWRGRGREDGGRRWTEEE